MKLEDLVNYVEELKENGLETCEVKFELTEDGYVVTKTKETYKFHDEQDADALISEKRCINGFAGCDKKFKEGKEKKNGDVTLDTYTVVIKLNH